MKILFLFVDGIGLGVNNPDVNPLARAAMPVLQDLLGGKRLVASAAPLMTGRATLLGLDACLGVHGVPQSATGQAVLLTGLNVPAAVGYHFGPWPNQAVTEFLKNGNVFSKLKKAGKEVAFLNAYPPRYFAEVQSGHRLNSAIPLAAITAGLALRTETDLQAGQALSADFTAQGWRERLNLADSYVLSPYQAGKQLAQLALCYDFSFFEYWLSDYAGHEQDMVKACELMETLDQVLGGLLANWDYQNGLILMTSDHGNMEDLSTRRHTINPVPVLLIGAVALRRQFALHLYSLTDIAPAIYQCLVPHL